MSKNKVILGMSGGVDSSTALYLLKEQGFDVIGVSLKFGFWENRGNELKENVCCSKESINRAKKVCEKYGAPHFVVDVSKQFKKAVIDYFLKTLEENKTPSPCLFCNRDVKIAGLMKFAKGDLVATGHYARIKDGKLLKAKDKQKDQTYFLALLKKEQLDRLIFPLGDYTKEEVYAIARREGIKHSSKESQDLCFVADKSLPSFLSAEIGINPGNIIDTQRKVLGRHKGLHFYTLGQRKGIGLPGGPYWVKEFRDNDLIVTKKEKDLFSKKVSISDLNFLIEKPKKAIKVEVKLRYRQEPAEAKLDKKELIFKKSQRAPTPGQVAVFYQGDLCLGGGIIYG